MIKKWIKAIMKTMGEAILLLLGDLILFLDKRRSRKLAKKKNKQNEVKDLPWLF